MPKRKDILLQLDNYHPKSLDEQGSKILMLDFIENNKNCFMRENLEGHVTASSWVVSNCGEKVLLVHHKKLGLWLQAGGHCDGDFNVFAVAKKELEEETGVTEYTGENKIFDIDVHVIPEHKGVPEHIHYDVRYLFRADAEKGVVVSDESNDVKWFTFGEVKGLKVDESVARMLAKTLTLGKLA